MIKLWFFQGEMAFKAVLYPKGDPPPADFDKEINDDWNDEFYKVPRTIRCS